MAYSEKRQRGCLSEYEGSGILTEPAKSHTSDKTQDQLRGPSTWLLTDDEERERDNLISKVQVGIVLSTSEKERLRSLLSKKGLGDEFSKVSYIRDSDKQVFLPR